MICEIHKHAYVYLSRPRQRQARDRTHFVILDYSHPMCMSADRSYLRFNLYTYMIAELYKDCSPKLLRNPMAYFGKTKQADDIIPAAVPSLTRLHFFFK